MKIQGTHGESEDRNVSIEDQSEAIETAMSELVALVPADEIAAIGHRIVHGGPHFDRPHIITDDLRNELQDLASFDPEHAPAALLCITATRKLFPEVLQVACFDTTYFHDLPRIAQIIPLPREYEATGVRRYGFHGLSYSYLHTEFGRIAGHDAAQGKIIFAHLGSGVSLAAVHGGKPVDTTMSFSPASGVMMSTRAGDLDPGIGWFLNRQFGIDPHEFNQMVNFRSGLLGVSGLSADMLKLLNSETTHQHAREATELFCYDIKKSIGSLAAVMGGLDSLIFSGGIGEKSAAIRSRVCEGLEFLGIELDDTRNTDHAELISRHGSPVGIHIIPTDEAQVICRETNHILNTTN